MPRKKPTKPREAQQRLFGLQPERSIKPFMGKPQTPAERVATQLAISRVKRPAWYPGKSKTVVPQREVHNLFTELSGIAGVNPYRLAEKLRSHRFQENHAYKRSGLLRVDKMVETLMRMHIDHYRGIDYSKAELLLTQICMFMNNKRLSNLIKRKKALPAGFKIELDRQERHLRSIAEGVRKRGM